MGRGVSVICSKCGYSETLFEGVGMMSYNFEVFRKSLTKKRNEKIQEVLDKHDVKKMRYYNAYARCTGCGRLTTVPYVKIEYDENKIYTIDYRCGICKKRYEILTEKELLKCKCPRCSEKLENMGTMFWD